MSKVQTQISIMMLKNQTCFHRNMSKIQTSITPKAKKFGRFLAKKIIFVIIIFIVENK